MNLLDIEDAGMRIKVYSADDNMVELEVAITANLILSWDRVNYSFTFSKSEFSEFIINLSAGKAGWHGRGNFWYAKKIFIKKPNHPYQFRDLKLVNRFLIVGPVQSATFSKKIIDSLSRLIT